MNLIFNSIHDMSVGVGVQRHLAAGGGGGAGEGAGLVLVFVYTLYFMESALVRWKGNKHLRMSLSSSVGNYSNYSKYGIVQTRQSHCVVGAQHAQTAD